MVFSVRSALICLTASAEYFPNIKKVAMLEPSSLADAGMGTRPLNAGTIAKIIVSVKKLK
jgi:hypothetical protein